jgi:hypothetical protein
MADQGSQCNNTRNRVNSALMTRPLHCGRPLMPDTHLQQQQKINRISRQPMQQHAQQSEQCLDDAAPALGQTTDA